MKEIRTKAERERALDILESGFTDSEGVTWMLGKNISKARIRRLLSMFLLEASLKKGAFIASDNNGVLLFFRLQEEKSSPALFFKKLYALFFLMGFKRAIRAVKYKKMVSEIRPAKGWLGWFVATDSHADSKRAGYEIRKYMFDTGDKFQEPVFVETTRRRIRILYQRIGFEEYASVKHPYNDLDIWFLKREPSPRAQ